MSEISKATAGLSFAGIGLDADYVTTALGCQPTRINRRYAKGQGALWLLESSLDRTAALEQHISSLLDQLTNDLAIWRELTAIYKARVFCGVFMAYLNEGFELSPGLLMRLAERNLPVEFDIYALLKDSEE